MLIPGEKLGDYEILEPLSTGGMGAVYKARQGATGMTRALKIMLPEWVRNPGLRQRFEQEASAGSNIASEHVIKIVDYGVVAERDLPWIAMEYLSGRTLHKVMESKAQLSARDLRNMCQQLFHGVAAAHDAQLVHRDLKPDNIFIADSLRADVAFTVKVLDFGIAKQLEVRGQPTLAMGTPAWMAPEQDQLESIVTPAADVWALGLIVFWLVTGKPFWLHAGGPRARLSSEMHQDTIPSASERALQLGVKPLGAGFDVWFTRCVQRDPALRFQHARQCWESLARVLDVLESSHAPTETPVEVAGAPTGPTAPHESSRLLAPPLPERSANSSEVKAAFDASASLSPASNPVTTRRNWTGAVIAVSLLGLAGVALALARSSSGEAPGPVSTVAIASASKPEPLPTLAPMPSSRAEEGSPPSESAAPASPRAAAQVPTVRSAEAAGFVASGDLSVQIYAERSSGLVAVGPGQPLRTGDHYAFHARAQQRAYAAVYELGRDQVLKRLYPPTQAQFAGAKDLTLSIGEVTRVPPAAEGDFVVDAAQGLERLIFVHSSQPVMRISDADAARSLKQLPTWPPSWASFVPAANVSSKSEEHTVVVRGSYFAPRRSAPTQPGAPNIDFVLAAIFVELDHTN